MLKNEPFIYKKLVSKNIYDNPFYILPCMTVWLFPFSQNALRLDFTRHSFISIKAIRLTDISKPQKKRVLDKEKRLGYKNKGG